MNPDIFITDFERTENTDELQSVLGRALIIATRFDSMCNAAAVHLELKQKLTSPSILGEAEYQEFALKIVEKYRTLNQNINALSFLGDITVSLHEARKARNYVAHELAKGLTGCLDTKCNEGALIQEVSDQILDIAEGDIAISLVISALNHDSIPNKQFLSSYKERIINWVIER